MTANEMRLQIEAPQRGLAPEVLTRTVSLTFKTFRAVEERVRSDRGKKARLHLIEAQMNGVPYFMRVASDDDATEVADALVTGIRQLNEAPEMPSFFDLDAVKLARDLVLYSEKELTAIEISSPSAGIVRPSASIITNAKILTGDDGRDYWEWTSIVGILDRIDRRSNKYRCEIWNPLGGYGVKCHFEPKDEETVRGNIPKRVEVFGRARFNSRGSPVQILASKIHPFPLDEHLPTLADLRGINLSAGEDPADYIYRQRDED